MENPQRQEFMSILSRERMSERHNYEISGGEDRWSMVRNIKTREMVEDEEVEREKDLLALHEYENQYKHDNYDN